MSALDDVQGGLLRNFIREGLVLSEWETSSAGPARRTYRLSQDGVDWLHAWAGALRETRRILANLLDRYEDAFSELDVTLDRA